MSTRRAGTALLERCSVCDNGDVHAPEDCPKAGSSSGQLPPANKSPSENEEILALLRSQTKALEKLSLRTLEIEKTQEREKKGKAKASDDDSDSDPDHPDNAGGEPVLHPFPHYVQSSKPRIFDPDTRESRALHAGRNTAQFAEFQACYSAAAYIEYAL